MIKHTKGNKNTSSFWNTKIKDNRKLFVSPVFLHKNIIVLTHLLFARGNFLDVGFGYGLLEKFLSFFNKSLNLYGVDISTLAVAKIKKDKINGDFHIGNVTNFPFKNIYFDYITALDVLEHLTDIELIDALKEISKYQQSGGVFWLSVPLNETLMDKNRNRHIQNFDIHKLKILLEKSNYKIQKKIYLSAFKKFYIIKYFLNKCMKLYEPNLLILKTIKK